MCNLRPSSDITYILVRWNVFLWAGAHTNRIGNGYDHLLPLLALAARLSGNLIEFWMHLMTCFVIHSVCIINIQHYSVNINGFMANAEHFSS